VRERRRLARTLEHLGSAAYAVPVFFFAMLLFVLASETGLFPIGMTASPGYSDLGPVAKLFDLLHHLVLPWVTLFLLPALTLVRQAELEVERLERSEFVLAAIGRGATRGEVFRQELRRPLVIALVRRLASDIPLYVTYLVIVEMVFLYTGLGYYVVWPYTSYSWRDTGLEFAVSQSALVYLGAFTVLSQFVARASLVALDPRYGSNRNTSGRAASTVLFVTGAVVVGALLAVATATVRQRVGGLPLAIAGGILLAAAVTIILVRRNAPARSDTASPGIEVPDRSEATSVKAAISATPEGTARDPERAWPVWIALVALIVLPWVVPRPVRPLSVLLIRPDVIENPGLLWYFFRSALTAGRGLVVVIACGLAGVVIGAAGGVRVGLHDDSTVDRVFAVGAVFPAVLIVIAAIGMVGSRPPALLMSLTLIGALRFYPHARDSARLLAGSAFAGYARVLGERGGEFLLRHIIPNFLRLHAKSILLLLSDLVVLRANLAFLGLTASRWSLSALATGPAEPGLLPVIYEAATLDWGLMLADVRSDFVREIYVTSIFPAILLIGFVLLVRAASRRLP
jgi:ABC-type dipeptide/oligopeptide/nickel transport system permease component